MSTSIHIWNSLDQYILLLKWDARGWQRHYPRHQEVPWIFASDVVERHLRSTHGMDFESLHRELFGGGSYSVHETREQRITRMLEALRRSALLLKAPPFVFHPAPRAEKTQEQEQATGNDPVKIATAYTVELLTAEGFPVPQVAFEVTFADGSKWKGTLDKKGSATRIDPPPGPLQIRYLDDDDILAKTLAVRVRRGWEARSYGPLFDLAMHSPKTVQKAVAAYDAHFNDFGGQGFRQDVQDTFTDPVAYAAVTSLLARSDVRLLDAPKYHTWTDQDSA